jgi:hypothetical protein
MKVHIKCDLSPTLITCVPSRFIYEFEFSILLASRCNFLVNMVGPGLGGQCLRGGGGRSAASAETHHPRRNWKEVARRRLIIVRIPHITGNFSLSKFPIF